MIDDYAYIQSIFRAFHQKHSHIQIDLFILENRCTDDEKQWLALKNHVLYVWLEICGFTIN
ncbi:hypothetical protein GCM10007161_16620 [Ignatzschineria indica]|uniref:Uncharacterized protein n=1 Tax=Ignatzschineria indica TaxID=472583 RepID=A0A2U2AIY8_9GAMM|nr:hypothetical protein DC082_08325 [Ignatzschineria indica]GGZ85384.1 hypothetical protein GCM10007161_16620 [Ignatzschineria indica]